MHPDAAWRALRVIDLMEVVQSPPVRAVMAARGLPDAVARKLGREPTVQAPERLLLAAADGSEVPGWHVLGEEPGHELVVGAIGRFWGAKVDWLEIAPEDFEDFEHFDRAGYAKIAWSFSVRPYGATRSLVTNECRTLATDAESRRAFLRYWRVVGRGPSYVMGRSLPVLRRHADEAALNS